MPPPAPAPAAAAPLDAASLGREARERLNRLLGQLRQNYVQTETAAADLAQRTEDSVSRQLHTLRHRYGVFLVGDPARPMVLRDVEKLDGHDPIAPATDDFAAALSLVNSQLRTRVRDDAASFAETNADFGRAVQAANVEFKRVLASSAPPPNIANLLRHLHTLLAGLEKLEPALTGSGTAADPFRAAPGRAVYVAAPLTLAFATTPDALHLTARERTVDATAPSAAR